MIWDAAGGNLGRDGKGGINLYCLDYSKSLQIRIFARLYSCDNKIKRSTRVLTKTVTLTENILNLFFKDRHY